MHGVELYARVRRAFHVEGMSTREASRMFGLDRRTAAHHQVAVNDGKLILHSAQARKLLKRIKDLRPAPAKTVDDINQWVEAARGAYEQGQNVLANLDRLAEEVAKRQAK